MDNELQFLLYLAMSTCIQHILGYMKGSRRPDKARCVGVVAGLNLYPVKSMRGLRLDSGFCTHSGLEDSGIRDRSWAVVISRHGVLQAQTGRQYPILTTVKTGVEYNAVILSAEGHGELKLTMGSLSNDGPCIRLFGMDVHGVDCGAEAGDWISAVIGEPNSRIFHLAPSLPHRPTTMHGTIFKRPLYLEANAKDKVAYQDSASFSIMTDKSLEDLNSRLDIPRQFTCFRPTIEVQSNCPAYDEDAWSEVYIGEACFSNFSPIERCKLTTVDPEAGRLDPDNQPLETLKSYRVFPDVGKNCGPSFGRLLSVDREGEIRVGQSVYVLRKDNCDGDAP